MNNGQDNLLKPVDCIFIMKSAYFPSECLQFFLILTKYGTMARTFNTIPVFLYVYFNILFFEIKF